MTLYLSSEGYFWSQGPQGSNFLSQSMGPRDWNHDSVADFTGTAWQSPLICTENENGSVFWGIKKSWTSWVTVFVLQSKFRKRSKRAGIREAGWSEEEMHRCVAQEVSVVFGWKLKRGTFWFACSNMLLKIPVNWRFQMLLRYFQGHWAALLNDRMTPRYQGLRTQGLTRKSQVWPVSLNPVLKKTMAPNVQAAPYCTINERSYCENHLNASW